MTAKQERSEKLMTPKFRVSYPFVFEPRKGKNGKKDKYCLVMLIPKNMTDPDDIKRFNEMKKVVADLTQAKWGAKAANMKLNKTFQDGDLKYDKEGNKVESYTGMIYANLGSTSQPGIVDQNLQPIISAADFYAGCWARATVNAFTYEEETMGVAFGLNNLQKMGDDQPFGKTGAKAEDDFSAVGGASTDAVTLEI